ncbi:hypothetical protein T09_11422 [Trichinella sp. T9]|nr:hypothetical protein T09_11422 [Trichinella sp. T9]
MVDGVLLLAKCRWPIVIVVTFFEIEGKIYKCEDQCYLKSRLFEVGRQITMTRCAVKIEKRIFLSCPFLVWLTVDRRHHFAFATSQWCEAILLSLTKQIAMLNYQMGCSGVITTLCFVWAIWD